MAHSAFVDAMRRVITGEGGDGRSAIVIDAPPSGEIGAPGLGGLYEIWEELNVGKFHKQQVLDSGALEPMLSPGPNQVKVRWFVIEPPPPGVTAEAMKAAARERFAQFGAEHELRDQDRHPAMHQTETLDIICLISGDASLVLDDSETPETRANRDPARHKPRLDRSRRAGAVLGGADRPEDVMAPGAARCAPASAFTSA